MKKTRLDRTPFDKLSQETMRSPELSMKAKCILAIILGLPDTWKLSIRGLSKFCKEGNSAIRAAINELEESGYLKRTPTRNFAGKYSGTDYSVREVLAIDFPNAEKPDTEKPNVAKPHAENQSLKKEIPLKKKCPINRTYKAKITQTREDLLNNPDFSLCLEEFKASGKAAFLSEAQLQEDLEALSKYPVEVAVLIARQSISKGWRRLYYEKSAERVNEAWHEKNGKGKESVVSKNEAVSEELKNKYRKDYESRKDSE